MIGLLQSGTGSGSGSFRPSELSGLLEEEACVVRRVSALLVAPPGADGVLLAASVAAVAVPPERRLAAACRLAARELRVRAVRGERCAGVLAAAVGAGAGWPLALAPATVAVVAVVELDDGWPEGSEAFGAGVAFVVVIVAVGVVTSGTDAAGGVETSTFATGGASLPDVEGFVSTVATPGTSIFGSDGASTPSVGVSTCTPITCGTSIETDDEADSVSALGPESVTLNAYAGETPSAALDTSAIAVASAAP